MASNIPATVALPALPTPDANDQRRKANKSLGIEEPSGVPSSKHGAIATPSTASGESDAGPGGSDAAARVFPDFFGEGPAPAGGQEANMALDGDTGYVPPGDTTYNSVKTGGALADRDMHTGLPGESEDGRMGADIKLLIDDITSHRDLLNRHSKADVAQLKAVETELELLDYRIFKLDDRIEKRSLAQEKFHETRLKVQDAFNVLKNKANTIANILEPMTEEEYKFVPEPDTAHIREPVKHERKQAVQTTV